MKPPRAMRGGFRLLPLVSRETPHRILAASRRTLSVLEFP